MHIKSSWKQKTTRFLTAQTISLLGSSIVQYAVIWHLTLSASSGALLTISTLCGFVPQIAISLFAGAWLDRFDRKKAIMLSDGVIALTTLVLALAFAMGKGSTPLLLAALAIRAAGTGVQTPAVAALLPQIVPEKHRMRVTGISGTLSSMTMLLSPALAGAALSIAPLEVVLFLDVITAIVGVGMTATVQTGTYGRDENATLSGIACVREGLSYVRKNRFVSRLLCFQLVILFLISPSAFLTPLLVSRTFGAQVWYLTASESAYSLGMVLGGVLIATWGGFRRRLDTTLLAAGAYGLLMLGLGLSQLFALYLICNLLIGITSPCYNAPITVSLQERVPAMLHGRIFSLLQIASSCALPLGMVVFGPLADRVPVQALLCTAGVLVLLAVLLFWRTQGQEM